MVLYPAIPLHAGIWGRSHLKEAILRTRGTLASGEVPWSAAPIDCRRQDFTCGLAYDRLRVWTC